MGIVAIRCDSNYSADKIIVTNGEQKTNWLNENRISKWTKRFFLPVNSVEFFIWLSIRLDRESVQFDKYICDNDFRSI